MGLSISFESAKMAGLSENSLRFKHGREAIKQGDFAPYFYKGDPKNEQTGVIDNWLNFEAKCTTDVLAKLDKYCRDNHLAYISITNNSNLKQIGWPFKNKYASTITIESQYKNITAIRRTTIGKKSNRLLPIQKRVLGLK